MSAIAEAAGLSRPALYQHFANRDEIFRSALSDILEDANRAALDALDAVSATGGLADRFDGYLQRCRGDVIGPLLGSSHGDELLEARGATAGDVADEAHARRRRVLDRRLIDIAAGDRRLARRAAELLELAPLGLKYDAPSAKAYRTRLTALAHATAALIESAVADDATAT
ncbi:MAG: TetR family transcriptional regulator, partial [Actinomycetota bacterium]